MAAQHVLWDCSVDCHAYFEKTGLQSYSNLAEIDSQKLVWRQSPFLLLPFWLHIYWKEGSLLFVTAMFPGMNIVYEEACGKSGDLNLQSLWRRISRDSNQFQERNRTGWPRTHSTVSQSVMQPLSVALVEH